MDFRAVLDGVADQRLDLLDRLRLISGPIVGAGFHAWTDGELVDRLDQGRREAVVDAGLHQDAVGADAGLAGVAVFRGHCAGDSLSEIGVVENDKRRVAAELERKLLHRVGALPIEHLADCSRAGEGQLAHPAIVADHLAYGRRILGGHDVEHARRNAGIERELGDGKCAERRLSRRLDHDGASGGERGTTLRVIMAIGKFQGEIAAKTPIGCLMVR